MLNKITGVTLAAGLTLAGSALAADLPLRSPAPAFAPPPIFTWTGFYVGVNAGGSFGTTTGRLTVPATVNGVGNNVNAAAAAAFIAAGNGNHHVSGFNGGVTAGYNLQFNNIVIGVEDDIDYMHLTGSRVSSSANIFGIRVTDRTTSNWFGTARARLGFAFDRALIFVTGGAAFTDARFRRFNDNTVDGCPPVGGGFGRCHSGSRKFRTGWTVGGGVEYAFTNNWSGKAEYLYSDFGRRSFRTLSATVPNQGLDNSAKLKIHTVRVGLNYHF